MDILGTRMKQLESPYTNVKVDASLPLYVRLDGRSFHTFTRGLKRPFDPGMSKCMIETTEYLIDHFHADLGYTQSDEISLSWHPGGETSQFAFNGKIQKLASNIAAVCSVRFYQLYVREFGEPTKLPNFDCRVLSMTPEEVHDMFVWRQLDAQKNAINMVAYHHMSAKQLLGVHSNAALEILERDFNVNFTRDYPEYFRRGTFVRRTSELRMLTEDELSRIPEKHRPTEPVERTHLTRFYTLEENDDF